MRVAFLFNHYDVHQVPHTAPFAFELSRRAGVEVDVVASCDTQLDFARRLGSVHPGGHNVTFRRVGAGALTELADRALRRWVFVKKSAVLRRNARDLGSYDAIVSPERTAMRLASRYGQTKPLFIRSMHGAGDRAIGSVTGDCDRTGLLLVPGRKHVERYSAACPDTRLAVVGPAKFDAVRALAPTPPKLFNNDRPTVLYNPHFCGRVSSWQSMGADVLDWFTDQSEFNLIFAPHVVLWKRARRHKAHLPKRFRTPPPHIHIDLGSERSCDMSYIRAADIYLGDASSQVYEFLHSPRPCVFLDAHDTDWRNSPHHLHWRFGRVARSVSDMADALRSADATHSLYATQQRNGLAHTYSRSDTPVAVRGAGAIHGYLSEALGRATAPATADISLPIALAAG